MKRILVILVIFIAVNAPAQQKNSYKSIVSEEFIFTPQHEHAHGSSIVAFPNGDFLAVWFQGSGERTADDVRIMGARLEKGKKEWSKPFVAADTPGLPDCNPVVFLNNKGKLFLVWIAVQGNQWEGSILRTRTSTNYSNSGAPVWDWQDNILIKPGKEFEEEIQQKFREMPELQHGWAGYAPLYDDMIIEASKNKVNRSIGWMTRIKPLILTKRTESFCHYIQMGTTSPFVPFPTMTVKPGAPQNPLLAVARFNRHWQVRKNGDIVAYMRDSGDAPARVHKIHFERQRRKLELYRKNRYSE
jgi:hypothetical protein